MRKRTALVVLAVSSLLPLASLPPSAAAGGGGRAESKSGRATQGAARAFEFLTVTLDGEGKVTGRAKGKAAGFAEELGGGAMLEMVEIPGGSFMMGSPEGESDWDEGNEYPRHRVSVPRFYMGRYEVTQGQYKAVMGALPYEECPEYGDDSPVTQVPWGQADEFCRRLSARTGRQYRLPSEAEWEYAARAGTTTPYAFGRTVTPEFVNYNGEEPYGKGPKGRNRSDTVRVGSLGVANAFGLFDMHGNVAEWCADWWHAGYEGAPADGSAWMDRPDMEAKVTRGGSWFDSAGFCRSGARDRLVGQICDPTLGFRVAMSAGN